jgi:hypothetical protein
VEHRGNHPRTVFVRAWGLSFGRVITVSLFQAQIRTTTILAMAPKGCVVLPLSNDNCDRHPYTGGFERAFLSPGRSQPLACLILRSDVATIEVCTSKPILNATVTDSN